MPSLKTIRRRLSSVTTTRKIMRAMNMVAASKLQRNKTQLKKAHPFFENISSLAAGFKNGENPLNSVFQAEKPAKNALYIVITGDRGLCGGFNSNVTAKALEHMDNSGIEDIKIVAIGQIGHDFFVRRGKSVVHKYEGVQESAFYEDAGQISRHLIDAFADGKIDRVYVVYTRFESALSHVPTVEKLLPFRGGAQVAADSSTMSYDPDPATFFDNLMPVYLTAFIYIALLESASCEQAARMMSMDTAEKNASEIIDKLTRVYNRRRQAIITQEISEVVSGTNVMNTSKIPEKQGGAAVDY